MKIRSWNFSVILCLMLLIFTSCAHRQFGSGFYVKVKKGDSLKSLAKEFKVSELELKNANSGKYFAPNHWIFIPQHRGVLARILKSLQGHGGGRYYPGVNFKDGMKLRWPVPDHYKVSSLYGRRNGRFHHGIDIPASSGTRIEAVERGIVIHSDRTIRGYGNLTIIDHQNGFFSIYAHAQRNFTKVGSKVDRGDKIAEVGSTGHSTGPHLHFEFRKDNESMDPMYFFPTEVGLNWP